MWDTLSYFRKENEVSNREAGNRFENRCRDYLESLGFAVDKARAKVMMIRDNKTNKMRMISGPNDFFGCADLIAVHPSRPYTLFLQCTLDSGVGRKKDKLLAVPWNLSVQKVQIWMRQDGVKSGIRVTQFFAGAIWQECIFRMHDGENPPEGVL